MPHAPRPLNRHPFLVSKPGPIRLTQSEEIASLSHVQCVDLTSWIALRFSCWSPQPVALPHKPDLIKLVVTQLTVLTWSSVGQYTARTAAFGPNYFGAIQSGTTCHSIEASSLHLHRPHITSTSIANSGHLLSVRESWSRPPLASVSALVPCSSYAVRQILEKPSLV